MYKTIIIREVPPIQRVLGALALGLKRLVREANHSSLSSVEVKNAWSYTSTTPIRLHGLLLSEKKFRDYFTFTLPFTYFVARSQNLLGRTEENHENSMYSRSSDRSGIKSVSMLGNYAGGLISDA